MTTLLTRRKLLQAGATMVAAGWAVPSFVAETARIFDASWGARPASAATSRRVLVIVQLSGGNDGLNTLVPYGDPAYYEARPTLAIPPDQVLPIDAYLGLHPGLARLKGRYDAGQVAIVQGMSYPNPNRSHFRGTDIWESAVPDRLEPKGWMGRYLQACGCQREDHLEALTVGSSQTPGTFWTEMSLVPAVASIGNFRYTSVNNGSTVQRNAEIQTLRAALARAGDQPEAEFLRQSILTALTDADILASATGKAGASYPAGKFGESMKTVADLILNDVGTHLFFVSIGGFDTHSNQLVTHANLLGTLDQAVDAFFQDMEDAGRLQDVTLMTFSEFGRRLAGNGSLGSDHGIAAPHFLLGGSLRGGLYGQYPSLTDLSNGDLRMKVDFRSVYATVLKDWLSISPSGILEGDFPPLGLFGDGGPPSTSTVTPTPTETPTPTPSPTLTPTATPTIPAGSLITKSHSLRAEPLKKGKTTVTSTVFVQDASGAEVGKANVAVELTYPDGYRKTSKKKTRTDGKEELKFKSKLAGPYSARVAGVELKGRSFYPTAKDASQLMVPAEAEQPPKGGVGAGGSGRD